MVAFPLARTYHPSRHRPLTTEDRVTIADAKAAHERGRPVVLIRPPAVERAAELWELIIPATPGHGPGASPPVVIICADDASAAEWAAAAPAGLSAHAVTGLARTSRILKERSVDMLAGAVRDLSALVQRAALKLDHVSTVVVAWPEGLTGHEAAAALDTLLAEARVARRVVLSWNPVALRDFLERHAPRALLVGTPPVDATGAPLAPVCRARYATVASCRRTIALRDALDALNAANPFVWNGEPIAAPPRPGPPPDAVVCVRLPTRDELAALARLGPPLVLVTASQLPYLRSVATATPLALPSAADRGRDRAEALRERVAGLLTTGNVDAELALLDPLFERFDPAEVAGALLSLLGDEGRGKTEGTLPLPSDTTRVRVFVNVGKKDRVAAKDLVGALIREVGVAKGDIGRVEVRETFTLVDVAAGAAERAARGLTGVTIRGRRVAARLDRDV